MRAFGAWLSTVWQVRRHRFRWIENETALGNRSNDYPRIVSNRFANFDDTLRQRVVGHRRSVPHGAEQLVLAHQCAAAGHQEGQNLERLWSQADVFAQYLQRPTIEIEDEPPEFKFLQMGFRH